MYRLLPIVSVVLIASCASNSPTLIPRQPSHHISQAPVKDLVQLHKVAHDMVVDLIEFTPVVTLTAHERPPVAIETIQNNTPHWIDTLPLSHTIADTLVRSGRFSVIHHYKGDWDIGKDKLAYYDLTGELSQQKNGSYVLTLRLRNETTGLLVWEDSSDPVARG
jgi:PBP1b-binding outer membrane lipoprotein LpoB